MLLITLGTLTGYAAILFILKSHWPFSHGISVGDGLSTGSLLGPPLFDIFINEFNYAVPDVSLRL